MEYKTNWRFWQIHLSTAIVLMFVAGGLMWANLPYPTNDPHGTIDRPFIYKLWAQGWPLTIRLGSNFYDLRGADGSLMAWKAGLKGLDGEVIYSWPGIVIDVLIWLVLLSGTAIFTERVFRIN